MLTRQQNVYYAQMTNNPSSLFPQLPSNTASPDTQKLTAGSCFNESPKKVAHLPDI